jgi:ABC-type branched-subunit amino acid transport system ATPase component
MIVRAKASATPSAVRKTVVYVVERITPDIWLREVEEELRLMKLSEENERELHAQTNFWHIFQRQHHFPSLPAIVGFLGGTLSGGEEGQAEHTV